MSLGIAVTSSASLFLQVALAHMTGDECGDGQGRVKGYKDVGELEPDFPVGCCH